MAVLVLVPATAWLLIQLPPVQNWLVGKVVQRISKDLQTKIDIRSVDFSLFNKMHLQGVLVEDRKQDTILSAGEITVNITDWFFLKNNIELHYIGLKDAYIFLQRSDSVWRHQFLADYFASPTSTQPKKQNAITLAFKEVDMQNIYFKQKDAWTGQDMTISLASLNTDPERVDFDKKIIRINALTIQQPYVSLLDYKGNRPHRPATPSAAHTTTADSTAPAWNTGRWNVVVESIAVSNGTFKSDMDSLKNTSGAFDGAHIEFAKIYANLTQVQWRMDTITTHINISTKERSGFEVKHLIADAKTTPKEMTFSNLDLRTNDSYLHHYFSMKYNHFNDMSDFITKVKMEADIQNTELNSDDIAFFAPEMKTWKKKISLKGKVAGTVSALAGRQIEIQAGNQTYFSGDASLTGLPEINETFIDVKANQFNTTYSDAVAFVPSLKNITQPALSQLQYVNFKGNFTGFIHDFVTYGTLQTALGTVQSDLNMKLIKGRSPVYSGMVASQHFNVGAFIKEPALGYVSLNAQLKGTGFSTSSNIAVASHIKYIDYNNYRYNDITINGQLNKRLFDGLVTAKDPNANFTLNGLIDMRKAQPVFNFNSDITKIDFQKIKLLPEDLVLSGKINAKFSGNTIDNFLGNAYISQATLIKNGQPLSFDSLALTSAIVDNQKNLSLFTNEFTATLTGHFSIMDLPNSIKGFLTRYYPAYIKQPTHLPKNQAFSFDIVTHNFSDFIQLVDSSLYGFNNSHIVGSLNTANNNLVLEATVPQFGYDQYKFNTVTINAKGNYDSLSLLGQTHTMVIGDSLIIPAAVFNVSAKNDVSEVMIYSGGNNTVDQARLNAIVYTYNNGVKINFQPSSFVLNGKTWNIDNTGELEFRKDIPTHGQLVLKENTQEISIKTIPSDVGHWNNIAVTLTNFNLGDFAPYFLPSSNRLEGLANASILIDNPGKNMRISSQDFMGRAIRFDNDSLGDVSAKFVYDYPTQELIAEGKTLHPQQKDLAFNLHLYLKDKASQAANLIALQAHEFNLKYLNRFLGFLFSDIQGEITGNFDIKGPFNALSVVGKGRMSHAGLKVNFTQCFYKIEDREIELKENEINVDGMVLTDPVTNNPIYLRGNILHSSFDNMFFDITVSTRKPFTRGDDNNRPVQVLKTTYKDNKTFYGDVKGTGSFALLGPADNAFIKIDAIASTQDSSSFTIASSTTKAGQMPDWLVERKYGVLMSDSLLKNTASNITYELDVTANPNVLMKFVLDDLTGDEIKGRGNGTLNIRSGTHEPMAIRGRFDIEQGSYNYTFQSFFKKPFEIIKGRENYIAWSGDPMNANIHIEAQYKADKVSFAPLAAGTNLDQSYSSARENVFITAKLSGPLFRPAFQFGLQLDPNSIYKNDFNIANALQRIENSANEINRQVTYLIVFNSFSPPESASSSFGLETAANEFFFSSLSGILFNEINSKLNNELSKILNTDKVSVVFSGSVYNRNILSSQRGSFGINQSNFNVSVPISLFKDRFVISLGSTLDVPLQSSLQQNVQFLPDVTAEWLINPSGSIRLNFFYRENMDYLTTSSTGAARTKRTGGGISFRREFDNVGDLFRNARKRALHTPAEPQPLPPPDSNKVSPAINIRQKENPLQPQKAE